MWGKGGSGAEACFEGSRIEGDSVSEFSHLMQQGPVREAHHCVCVGGGGGGR